MTLAERLKGLREAKNLSQEQVAKACKVAVSTVSRWEDGSMEPRRKSFRALAQILEVSSSYLNAEVRSLEGLDTIEVARRESFRLFAEGNALSEDHRPYLERLLANGLGPRTISEWMRFSARLAVALGAEETAVPPAVAPTTAVTGDTGSRIILLPPRPRNKKEDADSGG